MCINTILQGAYLTENVKSRKLRKRTLFLCNVSKMFRFIWTWTEMDIILSIWSKSKSTPLWWCLMLIDGHFNDCYMLWTTVDWDSLLLRNVNRSFNMLLEIHRLFLSFHKLGNRSLIGAWSWFWIKCDREFVEFLDQGSGHLGFWIWPSKTAAVSINSDFFFAFLTLWTRLE